MFFLAPMLLVSPIEAWVTKSQSIFGAQISEIQDMMDGKVVARNAQAQLGYLWTMPASIDDTTGLGGGITWAFNPKLCDLLQPIFKEDVPFLGNGVFVGCSDYKAAIARAFDKWSANSRFIKFIDVSEECTKLGLNHGPPTDPPQTHKYSHGGCPLAEIWVTNKETSAQQVARRQLYGENPTHGPGRHLADLLDSPGTELLLDVYSGSEQHRLRRLEEQLVEPTESNQETGGVAVATALTHARYTSDFRYTNGDRPFFKDATTGAITYGRSVVEAYAGTFSFNVCPVRSPS